MTDPASGWFILGFWAAFAVVGGLMLEAGEWLERRFGDGDINDHPR